MTAETGMLQLRLVLLVSYWPVIALCRRKSGCMCCVGLSLLLLCYAFSVLEYSTAGEADVVGFAL